MLPIVVAHRANTLKAIRRYLKLGVPVIEVDVRKRKGKLVLLHGPRESYTVSFLENILMEVDYVLFSGDPLIKPLSLEEVLRIINGKAGIWLDIKERGIEEDVVSLLDKIGFMGEVYVSSDYHIVVREFKRMYSRAKTAIILKESPIDPVLLAKLANADIVAVEYVYVDGELVTKIHGSGRLAAAWVVNDRAKARELASIGVDIIITDKPSEIMSELRRWREETQCIAVGDARSTRIIRPAIPLI